MFRKPSSREFKSTEQSNPPLTGSQAEKAKHEVSTSITGTEYVDTDDAKYVSELDDTIL